MERLTVGMLDTNCYLLSGDLDPQRVLVIDPGAQGKRILEAVGQRTVEAVLLTHGHFDHTGALGAFRDRPVYLGRADAEMLGDPEKSAGFLIGDRAERPCVTLHPLEGGESLSFPGFSAPVRVLSCPGHTPGGVSFLYGNDLFSGDTLFCRGYGRTDLPGGDERQLFQSIRGLLSLEGNPAVHPGHGKSTSLDEERRFYGM